MNKTLGLVIVAVGALFMLKLFAAGWLLFLVIGGALALGASTGVIGRWGYALAALFGLMAVPALMFTTVFATFRLAGAAIGMTVKMLPFLLVAYGAYVLLKAFGKR